MHLINVFREHAPDTFGRDLIPTQEHRIELRRDRPLTDKDTFIMLMVDQIVSECVHKQYITQGSGIEV